MRPFRNKINKELNRKNYTRKFRIGLLAVLMLCVLGAWGQTDVSGFYYIANNNNGGYLPNDSTNNWYLVPASGCGYTGSGTLPTTAWAWGDPANEDKPFLTTYKTRMDNNPTCQIDYNSVWQIIKVEGDAGYYFIRHCGTGKYIVYNDPVSTNRRAFHLEESDTPSSLGENARFEIKYNSGTAAPYYILRKNLSTENKYFNPSQGNKLYYYGGEGSSPYVSGLIGVYSSKSDNGSKWFLEVPRPVISYDNVTRKASISSTLDALNPNYDYYYTTNGDTPIISNELKYNGPFNLTSGCTVKAIAVSTGGIKSQVASMTLEQVATPVIQKDETNNCITITSATEGATFYFTDDGSTPTTASSVYSEPLGFNYSQKQIKAIAAKPNMLISEVVTGYFTLKCPMPEIYPDFETNLVNLFCDAENATIYYSLDNSTPTIQYTGPFPISGTVTVKAYATCQNCDNSDIATYDITKAATPVVQLDAATNNIIITTSTIGATIYYTIDGSEPTTESLRYTGPFREGPEHAHVSGVDIQAIAVKSGMFWSEVGNGNVTLTCEPPLITRTGANTFEISCTFPVNGASIYYTTDGTDPTILSTQYSGSFTLGLGVQYTIKAIVVATNYNDSPIAERIFTSDLVQENGIYLIQNDYDYALFVNKANTPTGASSHYKLVANISAAGTSMVNTAFTGLFEGSADSDGNFYTISDLDHPMFREINPGITDGTIPTNQGIVRNVILKDVNIANHEGNTGAIACEIRGGACIYNCGILSGSVGGTGNVGGLVGLLQHTSVSQYQKPYNFTRVINCYSYADITSKGDDGSGNAANWAAGIVGNNSYESKVENYPYNNNDCKLKTAVINCMFYGDITTQHGINIAPVFGNKRMSNLEEQVKAINRYDYFLDGSKFAKTFTESINQFRASWPADEKHLTHYEYYRSILNSNRLLCTSYVTGKSGENVYQDTALIAKWVRDESIAPYPILKKWGKYPSIINPDTERVWDTLTKQWMNRANALDYQGKSFGTLSVTVKSGEHRYTATVPEQTTIQLTITDIDTLHWDYGYYKVQLPYYNTLFGNVNSTEHNIRYGGNYTDWVVTGWKITMVNGQTSGATTFVENWEHGYNFADRTDKFRDLYSVSGRVYAQGGFYYVPEGVTSIVIEAYWGKAYYLRNKDQSIDRVSVTNPKKVGSDYTDYGFAPAGNLPSTFQGLPVYDSLQTAIKNLDDINACPTVYDQAIVLVGNLQVMNKNKRVGSNLDGKLHPFTIMSADFDLDNEPDYCFQFQFRDQLQRWPIQPIRFDFLAVPELGLAIRHDDNAYAIGIFVPQGHFEITETAFMHTTQFEYDGVKVIYTVNGYYTNENPLPNEIPGFIYQYTPNDAHTKTTVTVTYVKNEAPLILNGGQFEQIVIRHSENKSYGFAKYTSYILMGGHFRMKRFTPGAHTNRNEKTKVRLCAVNCIGGEYPEFYLSGIYRPDIDPNVSGFEQGNPHCYTNGGKFGMIAGAGYDKILGNVTFKIDHSVIGEFYGGGINGTCPIGGNIDVTINNSIVGKYCGGPKVGNMTAKTVTTCATGTTFGQFYGGGNGGTNYYRDQAVDGNSWELPGEVWDDWEQLHKTNSGNPVATIIYNPDNDRIGFNPLNTRSDKDAIYNATKGYHGVFEFEVFNNSNGLGNDFPTIRTYVHWVQFGTTRTGNVSNTLTNCTVLQDFYGGGNLGFVDGDVVSTLQGNTIIYGSAYGGGYSAAIPTFRCYDLSRPIFPTRDLSGVMHHGELETDSIPYVRNANNEDIYYQWIHEIPDDWTMPDGFVLTTDDPVFEYPEGSGKWYCYTDKSLENLGVVSGNTTLNVNGNTKIYGKMKSEVNPELVEYAGAAFGGGDESAVLGNTTVTVKGTSGLLVSNVYGGGNIAVTGGNSTVEIYKGTIGIMNNTTGLPYTDSNGKFVSGRVFAAGKGAYDPTQPENGKQLGWVKGNSTLNMYGGHVLSCLYGGGEISNVGLTTQEPVVVDETNYNVAVPVDNTGTATITMTGGEVGIERTLEQIHESHEISNVYGSGQGNPSTDFNTWTNVNNAFVNINGGKVWGSVFGGGEEGHVLGNTEVTVSGANTRIGTLGETSYDGNVFGGGRGHEAIALTAGTIGGNSTIRVKGGHILGSVFGGGRNGSVGTYLVPADYTGLYGAMQPGDDHGIVNVYVGGDGQTDNIVIGHPSYSSSDRVGGNVYGGGKGVVEKPTVNPIAYEFAKANETHVYIAQATGKQTFIEGSVFGSGEDGHIMKNAYVTVSGGQIGGEGWVEHGATPATCEDSFHGNVYGGGRGLDRYIDEITQQNDTIWGYSATAGLVYGNTFVTIEGGHVCRNVYGGGNLASVGVPKDSNSGKTTILIKGDAIIGIAPNSANRNGIVFGAGKGRSGHQFQDLSFVKNTEVIITESAHVMGTVYGSGEDGHVRESTRIIIGNATADSDWDGVNETYSGANVVIGTNGVSGLEGNVYGAGRGIDKDEDGNYSPTAGEVGISTYIEINNGWVKGSVYGGGRTASVGTEEALEAEENTPADFPDFGHTTIIIGRDGDSDAENDHAVIGTESGDNGYVFGAGKGDAGSVFANLTNVFETNVTIKGHAHVRGSVFGGGEDGHVNSYSWTDPNNPEHTITKHGDTHVFIEDNCKIGSEGAFGRKGNVYGGGRGIDQYVGPDGNLHNSPTAGKVTGNTHVTISGGDIWQNVYGGGNKSIVQGNKVVNIAGGWVHSNVYGGSNEIPFDPTWSHSGLKTVNMSGGKAHKLFGCSHNTIDGDFRMFDNGNEVISIIDGQGNHKLVYEDSGTEYIGDVSDLTLEARNTNPTSFINISGGYLYDRGDDDNEERGSIHGAGLAGIVYGSVIVNIGADAINYNPYKDLNVDSENLISELTLHGNATIPQSSHQPTKLQVSGSVYGGADYYQSENNPGDWHHFNVKGYSNIYIDGRGYNMEEVTSGASFADLPVKCMIIDGNLYGSGTHCESGDKGRTIIVRNYGERINSTAPGQEGWFQNSTRPMGTIQRCDNLVIDHSNFTFTGAPRLGHDDGRLYSVMKVDSCFYVADSSALTLGSGDVPADMDSIRKIQSAYLIGQSASYNVFSEKFVPKLNWGWIGVVNPTSGTNANEMCFMDGLTAGSTLNKVQENIIIFNGPTKLWVRYHVWEKETPSSSTYVDRQYYGELKGFFRMLSPYRPRGIESFAYARPKIMDGSILPISHDHYNMADGGFLSYNVEYNDYLAPGYGNYLDGIYVNTNTLQYPYTNVIEVQLSKEQHPDLDVRDYRMWVMASAFEGNCWYVDGTRGWGRDIMRPESGETGSDYNWKYGWGLYPDKPKQSVSGVGGVYDGTYILDDLGNPTEVKFDYDGQQMPDHTESDIIFVVGPIKDRYEFIEGVHNGMMNRHSNYELRLFRYPGGHLLSNSVGENKYYDQGGGTPSSPNTGLTGSATNGPGPNYGAMLDVYGGAAENHPITLHNVYMDGLYGHTSIDRTYLKFKTTDFTQENVSMPMIVTHSSATLSLKGELTTGGGMNLTTGTIVTRGYNNTDASAKLSTEPEVYNYYINSNGNYQDAINGGGLYVDAGAMAVNVEGLVKIFENKQDNNGQPISSNVFLPNFNKHLYITNTLSDATRIGVTSPVKSIETGLNAYRKNTFSPIAVANKSNEEDVAIAKSAWIKNNFHDDLQWFFGCGFNVENGSHTTYYKNTIPDYEGGFTTKKTLFFGWTWNNVVRREPTDFAFNNINSSQDLAWLISLVNGFNEQTKNALSNQTITQTSDILDLDRYIWVPVGSEKASTANFAGTFDGCGHLIRGLIVRYIGLGDNRYEYNNYGMFGKTNSATINRTFVVNGLLEPNNKGNMGGLIGMMCGSGSKISNSEAAVVINCDTVQQTASNAVGGLVGFLIDGEIHSSMAMPVITDSLGFVGGLVGTATDPESNQHMGVKLLNSFSNAQFIVGKDILAGGLMGNNIFAAVENCYSAFNKSGRGTVASLIHTNSGTIKRSYGQQGEAFYVYNFGEDSHVEECYTYTPVITANKLGYMYSDNLVESDTTLTARLTMNAWNLNPNNADTVYSHWARPTLSEINDDMPVLLLGEFDGTTDYQGKFRSVGTYAGGPALQYGGPIRDGSSDEVSLALVRNQEGINKDCLFIYGDVTGTISLPSGTTITQDKVSIHEDAAILAPGALSSFGDNYVGVSFDNTSRNAVDYYGNTLTRDWHMLSSPLSDAPLGVDYTVGGNDQNVNNMAYQHGFQSETLPVYAFSGDGYFPNTVSSVYVKPTGEKYLYPYDYFCWYEPDWQWINFKRNGPSHWHFDTAPGHNHDHIAYHYDNDVGNTSSLNVNESELVLGKGYMMAINEDTYMQSHGKLNNSEVSILATALANDYGEKYVGHNLLGNPYHAYLDFSLEITRNTLGNSFYLYDADAGGYLTYAWSGSKGGAYPSPYLHPHQAFFIKTDKSKTITFTPSMVTTRQASTFRGMQPAYPLVNLYAEDTEGRREILVVEFERSENGGGFKSKALRNGKHQMYARFNNEDYGAFFAKQGTQRVLVCFKTDNETPTLYTLRWNLQNGDFHTLHLIDNITGVDYDMLEHDSYTFEASKYDYSTRFYIVFSCTDVEEHEAEETEGNFAFFDGSQWVINGNGQLQLIDMTGRVLQSMCVTGDQSRVSFNYYPNGIYLLRLYGSKSAKVQKIVLMQ